MRMSKLLVQIIVPILTAVSVHLSILDASILATEASHESYITNIQGVLEICLKQLITDFIRML